MKINQIEANLENKQVYGYKRDGNTVTAHRWKVFPLCGNLYLQVPQAGKYGQRYAHIALFFPSVKIGLDIGMLSGWQLDQYSAEDVERKIGFSNPDNFRDYINARMENGEYIKNSYIAFIRQYNEAQAGKMMAYKAEWTARLDARMKAEKDERERRKEQEQQERECALVEALTQAGEKIINGGYVENKKIDGKPLFLHLFDRNGVSIPIRSRGWVIDKLQAVTQCKDGSASISRLMSRKGEKVSSGFVSAYFELRNYLIKVQEKEREDANAPDACTEEESNHLFGKAI